MRCIMHEPYQFRMTHHCDVVIAHGHGSATATSTITIYCEPYTTGFRLRTAQLKP